MTQDNDKIISRIRKLLNLGGDDAAALGEAENALRFARRLMLQHNIAEGDVKAKDAHERAADAESVEYGNTEAYSAGASLTAWEISLTWAIVDLIGTIKWFRRTGVARRIDGIAQINKRTGQPMRASQSVFYGPAEDCADAAELLHEWQVTISAMARLRYGGVFRGPGRSYAEGFASALNQKVGEIKREESARIKAVAIAQQKTGQIEVGDRQYALVTQNALQLMKAKQDRASVYLEQAMGVKLSRGRSAGRAGQYHGDAYGAGRADGKAASMTRDRKKKLT